MVNVEDCHGYAGLMPTPEVLLGDTSSRRQLSMSKNAIRMREARAKRKPEDGSSEMREVRRQLFPNNSSGTIQQQVLPVPPPIAVAPQAFVI